MDRPFARWTFFLLGLALLAGAMAWIARRAVELDDRSRETTAESRRQELVRLALWRLETAASSVFVRESARPPHHYRPFVPVESLDTGIVRVPSPLLGGVPALVKLHFECATEGGALCSPQVPTGRDLDLALEHYSLEEPAGRIAARMAELRSLLETHRDWEGVAGFSYPEIAGKTGVAQIPRSPDGPPDWAFSELRWRDDALVRRPLQDKADADRTPAKKTGADASPAPAEPEAGEMRAVWLGDELVLVRPVRDPLGSPRLQGVWMDWLALNDSLVASVRDLLPDASLVPVKGRSDRPDDWMALVSLPLRLAPGEIPLSPAASASGLKSTLLLAWACLAIAACAIGFVLHRATQLSERRAAFVSAVTHELRTPLTTFRLYSEMLARGAVPDEDRRQEYLDTLHRESDRLSHLVENVLSFSRVERGRGAPRLETTSVADLLGRSTARARERSAEAGLAWTVDAPEAALGARVRADAGVVEQILFNLADNAAKYAASGSEPKALLLQVAAEGGRVRLTLRDFGPGLARKQVRALFRPFRKSAAEAAGSAPGVGLGLSLCRRLARGMGGDLRFAGPAGRGAAFVLVLDAG